MTTLLLLSQSLFWIPFIIACCEKDCGGYKTGIAALLVTGYLKHSLMFSRFQKRPIHLFMSLLYFAVSALTTFFFLFHSFSVSLYWLFSLFFIVAPLVLYTLKKTRNYLQTLIYVSTTIALIFNIYACKNSNACAYCGVPMEFRLDNPQLGRYIHQKF